MAERPVWAVSLPRDRLHQQILQTERPGQCQRRLMSLSRRWSPICHLYFSVHQGQCEYFWEIANLVYNTGNGFLIPFYKEQWIRFSYQTCESGFWVYFWPFEALDDRWGQGSNSYMSQKLIYGSIESHQAFCLPSVGLSLLAVGFILMFLVKNSLLNSPEVVTWVVWVCTGLGSTGNTWRRGVGGNKLKVL